jgi:hypothetical protein
MGRIAYTDVQKQGAKIQRTAKNKQWQLDNKEKFDAYMKFYYQQNKVKLNAQRRLNRVKQKERQQLIMTEIVDI